MGCCSSTSTQQTTIPPPTPEELALLDLSGKTMQAYLDESGYEVTKTEIPWEDTDQAKQFAQSRTNIQNQIDQLNSQLQQQPSLGVRFGGAYGNRTFGGRGGAQSQVDVLNRQLASINQQEADARSKYKPEVSYSAPRKKADIETEAIRTKYGENSPEYKAAYEKYQAGKIQDEKAQQNIDKTILARTQKLLNGDYGLNDNEKKFMDELLGPMKQAGLSAISYIDSAQTKDEGIGKALENFGNEIKKTGMNMGDALLTLDNRIKQTGEDMSTALTNTIETTKQLYKMGIEDFTSQQIMNLNTQAAALGRSPTDPRFQMDLEKNVSRQIQENDLQLGQYEAQARMGIAERTGAGLEANDQARVALAERTGQGMEGIQQARVGYAEQAANMRGQLDTTLAQNEGNIRSNLAYGLPPSMIGLGQNVGSYNNAIEQQRLANLAQGGYTMPMGLYGTQAAERMAQPTTTTHSSQSIASIVGGLIGTGMQGYATYAALRPRSSSTSTAT